MRRRAAFQPSHESLAAHLASLNTCRLSGCRTFKVNLHAPAGSAPAIPQKAGAPFGIPELTPRIGGQTIRVWKRGNKKRWMISEKEVKCFT